MQARFNRYIRFIRLVAGLPNEQSIFYITSDDKWSLHWDGHYITKEIQKQFDITANIKRLYGKSIDNVLHFASLGDVAAFLNSTNAEASSRLNKIVCTVFHGDIDFTPEIDWRINMLLEKQALVDRIVVSTSIMKNRFLEWGVAEEKLVQIPLGIDLDNFFSGANAQIHDLRTKYEIPKDKFVIGSFQKDGNGWEEGLVPKYVKGPDVFLEFIEKVAQKYEVFVLLTGPARGFVKEGLDKIGVPYRHDFLDDYLDLIEYFHCLDLYVVASREEGGPKSLLEAPACGVPLVTTKVGMAPDIHVHEHTALITESEDVDNLVEQAVRMIEDDSLRTRLIQNGLEVAKEHSWQKIAARYYHEVYEPIMRKLN